MALLKYDTSSQAWKDVESLVKYDTSANAWTDCESALKHDGTAWTEVWSGAPDGALVWKGKNVGNVGNWFVSTDKLGIIKDATFNNFIVQSELTSDGDQHRIDSQYRGGDIIIPSWASKIILDVDVITERTDLYMGNVGLYVGINNNSGSSSIGTARKGNNVFEKDVSKYVGQTSSIRTSFTCIDNTLLKQYTIKVVINNLYFE